MAGDWLKVEGCTPDKPEMFVIAEALGIDPDAVFGKCFRVWAWWDQHNEEGNARNVTKSLIDRIAGCPGFAEAMMQAGWLGVVGDMLVIPNFYRHNGQTAKNRALTAKRVAKHKRSGNDEGNGKVTPIALPREEKRREDINVPPSIEGGVPPSAVPDCPHDQIIALYHQILPMGRQIVAWGDDRKALLRTRWREKKARQNLEWWKRFFTWCSESKFLTGQVPPTNGRTTFEISLPWILKRKNFDNIIEGAYHK